MLFYYNDIVLNVREIYRWSLWIYVYKFYIWYVEVFELWDDEYVK